MNGLVNTGVSIWLTLGDVIGDLIDGVTLDAVVVFTLSDVVGGVSGLNIGLVSILVDDTEINLCEVMMV